MTCICLYSLMFAYAVRKKCAQTHIRIVFQGATMDELGGTSGMQLGGNLSAVTIVLRVEYDDCPDDKIVQDSDVMCFY